MADIGEQSQNKSGGCSDTSAVEESAAAAPPTKRARVVEDDLEAAAEEAPVVVAAQHLGGEVAPAAPGSERLVRLVVHGLPPGLQVFAVDAVAVATAGADALPEHQRSEGFVESRFFEECDKHKAFATGPEPRRAVRTSDGPSAESCSGNFSFISAARETGDYWCDSFCQICDKMYLPGNYEIHFSISGNPPPGDRYYVDLLDICRACTHHVLTRTNIFKGGMKSWLWLEKDRPLYGELYPE